MAAATARTRREASAYDIAAPRRPVNLSATVEELLGSYLLDLRARQADEQRALHAVIDAVNALHDHHGLLSDEFSSL